MSKFYLVALVLSFVFTSYSHAQSDCESSIEWSSSKVYDIQGTHVKHQGKLYANKGFSKNQQPGLQSLEDNPWKLIGFCDGSAVECSGATAYSPTKSYPLRGNLVVHNGSLYENQWYTKSKTPGDSDVWVYKGPCKGGLPKTPMVESGPMDAEANIKNDAVPAVVEKKKTIKSKRKLAKEKLSKKNNQGYPYGLLPTNASKADVTEAYTKWKAKYVTSQGCPAGKRVLFDDMKHTVSEGVAYGLICSGYMKDQELFDDIYKYYLSFLDPWGLMHWKIDDTGKHVGDNAATDADEDVAWMLLVADSYFGSTGDIDYKGEAIRIINLMMETMVEKDTYVLKPGDAWGGSLNTNICYYVPSYYKVFAKVTGDEDWNKVADKCYEILFAAWNENTGLVPDWCQADGTLPAMSGGKPLEWAKNLGMTYYYDATRTPWRIGMDYLWYGDKRADKYNKTVSSFVQAQGFNNIKDGYNLDGSTFSNNKTSAFVGPFAVATMANSEAKQAVVDAGYTANLETFNDVYYNDMVRLMMLIVQTGMFELPKEYQKL